MSGYRLPLRPPMKRTPLKRSRGTVIPPAMKLRVLHRDGGCVGYRLFDPFDCDGGLEIDHVRASGGLGMKSVTCDCNLVALCRSHHRKKTDDGKAYRPPLIRYLGDFNYGPHVDGHVV